MRNCIAWLVVMLGALLPSRPRKRGRHSPQEIHPVVQELPHVPGPLPLPQEAVLIRRLPSFPPVLDVQAGRLRSQRRAQADNTPCPPPPVEYSAHHPPRGGKADRDIPERPERPYLCIPRSRTERRGRQVDPWTG